MSKGTWTVAVNFPDEGLARDFIAWLYWYGSMFLDQYEGPEAENLEARDRADDLAVDFVEKT